MANEHIHLESPTDNSESYQVQVLRLMNEFRKEGLFCDATITAKGGSRYLAHRAVLAASSCYFRKLFSYNSQQGIKNEVGLDWLYPDEVEELLEFMYTGEIKLSQGRAEILIALSGYLVIQSLQERSIEFLLRNLNIFNCSSTLSLADQYGHSVLKSSCTKFLRSNIAQVSNTPSFLRLSKELITDVIRDDACVTLNQEQVFNAVILWSHHDLKTRSFHFEDLFSCIHLNSVSDKFLVETVAQEELVKKYPICLAQVKKCILAQDSWDKGKQTRPVNEFVNAVIICGGTSSKYVTLNSKSTVGFIPSLNKWIDLTDMTHGRKGHSTALFEGSLYCFGNYSPFEHESSQQVQRFELAKNAWSPSPPMPKGRYFHAAVTLFGQLYVLGGTLLSDNCKEVTPQVIRYNPVLERWYPVAPMNCARQGLSAVVLNGAIFATGGCDFEETYLKTVERYDPARDEWKFVGSMVRERWFASATVVKGKILVVGGRENSEDSGILSSCEEYDALLDRWTIEIDNLCTACFAAGIATFGNVVYVFGGECEDDAFDAVQRWDTETRQWTVVSKTPFNVSFLQAQMVKLPKRFLN